MIDAFEAKIVAVLLVHVRYRGVDQSMYSETFRLEMCEFKGRSRLERPHLYAISKTLEEIKTTLADIHRGWNRLKVDVFDSGDRDKEWEEHEELERRRLEREKSEGDAP
jgi:hypothetical protein